MTDPIQASSTSPLPAYQTQKGTQDPLPVSSPRARDISADDRATDDAARKAEAFKTHLDHTSVTLLEKPKHTDPFDLVTQGSVYVQPGFSLPL